MAKSRSAIVKQAQAWLGRKESDGSHKLIIDTYNSLKPAGYYKMTYQDAWCACFVSAVAMKCGYSDIIPTEVGCERMIQLFKNKGCWIESDAYVPSPGDIIFYDWQDNGIGDNTGFSDHVGIVEQVTGTSITVIEGNYSDSVKRTYHKVNGQYIRGYGVPKYDDGAAQQPSVPATPTSKPAKSVDEVAKEIMQGLWGNDPVRSAKLKAAGYDPKEVQAVVNKLCKANATKKSVETVAKEVWQGKWGNGADRKKRLEAAGYNYNEVQTAVNKLRR